MYGSNILEGSVIISQLHTIITLHDRCQVCHTVAVGVCRKYIEDILSCGGRVHTYCMANMLSWENLHSLGSDEVPRPIIIIDSRSILIMSITSFEVYVGMLRKHQVIGSLETTKGCVCVCQLRSNKNIFPTIFFSSDLFGTFCSAWRHAEQGSRCAPWKL